MAAISAVKPTNSQAKPPPVNNPSTLRTIKMNVCIAISDTMNPPPSSNKAKAVVVNPHGYIQRIENDASNALRKKVDAKSVTKEMAAQVIEKKDAASCCRALAIYR